MQRRELFSSLFSPKIKEKEEIVLRPPYYDTTVDSKSFFKECQGCEDKPCVTFCKEKILVLDIDGTPKIDFSKGGCTYCDECAIVCPTEVLKLEYKKNIVQSIEIDILKCMSWHGVMCFSCKDPCMEDAIEFLGIYKPSINQQKCTSCGFCVSRCPNDAIIIENKG